MQNLSVEDELLEPAQKQHPTVDQFKQQKLQEAMQSVLQKEAVDAYPPPLTEEDFEKVQNVQVTFETEEYKQKFVSALAALTNQIFGASINPRHSQRMLEISDDIAQLKEDITAGV